jgi:hypothetical protein
MPTKRNALGLPTKYTNAQVRVDSKGEIDIKFARPPKGPKRNPNRFRVRNESISQGFWRGGVFHPIRASEDYDPEAVGETRQYAKKKKSKTKKRAKR